MKNKVIIEGRITEDPKKTYSAGGRDFYEGVISVQRLSKINDDIPFTISEENLKLLGDRKRVRFLGNVRSYRFPRVVAEGEHQSLRLTLFVKEILPETGVETNEVEFEGELKKFEDRYTPFGTHLTDASFVVSNSAKGGTSYLPCLVWGRNIHVLSEEKIHSQFSCFGRFQSREYWKKNLDGTSVQKKVNEISIMKIDEI